jgi:predicted ATPase/KaiC/GvpD/RAD55 family RecA-like ATPase
VKEVPLVDRIEEMNVLKEAVYRAVHGEGGLVFVHGEAGIGKTRLLRELGAYAQSRGVRVLNGRCPALFRMDGVPPYIIWKEVIRDYLETCSPEQLYRVIGYYPAEVAKLVPELSQKLRSVPQSFSISPEQEQNRLFEAISQFITNVSQEAPLIVILDDLQWTDPSSLLLLHYVARGVLKTSLLLLGAYRSTDVDAKHPLTTVLTELNRERLPESIQLKRMSLDDVSEMIKSILEQEDVPAEFCKLVYEKTKGNPFFAEEVVKSLKEEDIIFREGTTWRFKNVSKIEFPETVKNVLKARFSRLDDECQNVLTMASFVGNDFTLEAMLAVTGNEKGKLLKLMDKLFRTGLIKEQVIRGEGICSFADILVRDVVYEEVSPLTRSELHGTIGCALEKVYSKTIDEHFGELASHFLESGNKEKALDYFLKAGEKAQKIYANAEASSYYQSALKLLEGQEDGIQEKARILETLGDIKRIMGEYDTCLRQWNEALSLRKQLGAKEQVARLHGKVAVTLWHDTGKNDQARQHFEKALEILEAEPENPELAGIYAARARMSNFTEDVTKARSWAEKALELGERRSDSSVIASACVDMGLVFNAIGDVKEAVEYMEKALKTAIDNGHLDTALRAYNNLAAVLPVKEIERRLDCYNKGLELAKKAGHIDNIAWFEGQLAATYYGMGDFEESFTLAKECDSLSRKIGNLFDLSTSTLFLGAIYYMLEERDKGDRYLNEALAISQKIDNLQSISSSYQFLGWCHYNEGEYSRAKEFYDKMSEIFEKAGQKSYLMYSAKYIAMNYIELGEIDKARTLIDDLHKFADEKQDKWLIASEDSARAILFRAEKKWNESIELLEKSLQEYEALGARRWNMYVFAKEILYEFARTYLERSQLGDKEKALVLLNQALELFQKTGARKDIEKVEAKIAFIETGEEASKPKSIELISTGYAELDNLLRGGIPSNYVVALTSPSCDERDLLVKSFVEAGANKGEITFDLTVDPSVTKPLAKEFTPNLYLFICNPQADAIIEDLPNVFKLKGVENLTEIGIALTSTIRKLDPSLKGPRRICIGLVSDVLLQHHVVQTRRWLTALMTELKSARFTTLALFYPEMHSSQDARAILDLFDGEINIREKETEKGVERYLRIRKMSNHRYLEDELPLKKEQS